MNIYVRKMSNLSVINKVLAKIQSSRYMVDCTDMQLVHHINGNKLIMNFDLESEINSYKSIIAEATILLSQEVDDSDLSAIRKELVDTYNNSPLLNGSWDHFVLEKI